MSLGRCGVRGVCWDWSLCGGHQQRSPYSPACSPSEGGFLLLGFSLLASLLLYRCKLDTAGGSEKIRQLASTWASMQKGTESWEVTLLEC